MRYVLPILALIAVIAGLAGIKYQQISGLIAAGEQMKKSGPPPETVGTATSAEQTWERTLSAVGNVTAVKGVVIANEVPGSVVAIHFESGQVVRAGQPLVELDTSVERAQLASLESRLEYARIAAGRTEKLAEGNAIAQAALDADQAQRKTATRDVETIKAQIERKTTRAPFTGRLGIRSVNLGQYLNPGTAVTTLDAIDSVYVDFTLPQQRLAEVSVGMPVRISVEGADGLSAEGTIGAVDPSIDLSTRSIKLRAAVPNHGEKLRPGMFVSVAVILPQRAPFVVIPATALVHASYGDSVFTLEPKKDEAGAPVTSKDGKPVQVARQQFVRVGEARGDYVAILDGVKAGAEVVTAGAFKLRNNAAVIVDNQVKPKAELSPRPDNR